MAAAPWTAHSRGYPRHSHSAVRTGRRCAVSPGMSRTATGAPGAMPAPAHRPWSHHARSRAPVSRRDRRVRPAARPRVGPGAPAAGDPADGGQLSADPQRGADRPGAAEGAGPLRVAPRGQGVGPTGADRPGEPGEHPRLAEPLDVTRLLLFITSQYASFATGSEFIGDGACGSAARFPTTAGESVAGQATVVLG